MAGFESGSIPIPESEQQIINPFEKLLIPKGYRLEKEPPKEIERGTELSTVQDYLKQLYGDRNDLYRRSRKSRIRSLQRSIQELTYFINKRGPYDDIALLNGRALQRTFTIAQGVNDSSVTQGMIEKFSVCARCGNSICTCTSKLPSSVLAQWSPDNDKNNWSIKDWQLHLKKMYGDKNQAAGIDNVLSKLQSETVELIYIEESIFNLPQDEIRTKYREEIADCFAWIIGIANVLDIDIEKSLVDRYGHGCYKCGLTPCVCGAPHDEQVRLGDIDYGLQSPDPNGYSLTS